MMIRIWKERIVMLGAVDTGYLHQQILARQLMMTPDVADVSMEWSVPEYGIYVNRGTGREVARGNGGDIGRPKVREAKPWMNRAFYSSTMNLKEFMAESLGLEAMAIVSAVFNNPIRGVL